MDNFPPQALIKFSREQLLEWQDRLFLDGFYGSSGARKSFLRPPIPSVTVPVSFLFFCEKNYNVKEI